MMPSVQAALASTPIVPSTLPPFARGVKSPVNGTTLTEAASRPQKGATTSVNVVNVTSSDANTTSIPEESERVLKHLMHLMDTLNHVPYLEALSRGPSHGKDRIPVIKEAVKELRVGEHDNATLSVTLYESPQEGGEALPTMQKEFIFVHPPTNASQDLAPAAGSLHGHVSPHSAQHSAGGLESQGYRYGQWATGGQSQQHEQHGRQREDGAHRHLEDARARVHKERGHDKGGQAERKYRVRTEIEYFEREKFKDDEHHKLKAAHRSKTSTDAIKGADRFASQGHQSHQRHLGGGYAQGTHHAVGAGYAPVYVHGAPATGGSKGIDGGSRGFSQKDAQNHEEYHHEAGSQGFTDKDKGHQRAGWRERGYRIIAEKEYVDKDKHHDKAYGVDNQEQGHRLKSQGQHGHKQGHDDIKKAKEHYSRGVHDSAHHEKAKNSRGPYGKAYQIDGSTVHPAGPRDHLSSSTDKVAELEPGNATNSPDDETRRKKIIRIRVLSKTPGVASVRIGGQAANVAPETAGKYNGPEGDVVEPAGQVSPPRGFSEIDNSGRSAQSVAGGMSTDSEQTPKKHFVPMEVLASLYTNVRGAKPLAGTREEANVNNQHYVGEVHHPAVHNPASVNSRALYNEKSFQAVAANPGLRDENGDHRNSHYGTETYHPPSNAYIAGPPTHRPPTAETGGRTHYAHQEYIPGPPSRLTAPNQGNYQAQRNVGTVEGTDGRHFEPNSEIAVNAGSPHTATSVGQDGKGLPLNEGDDPTNVYRNAGVLSVDQVPAALAVLTPSQHTRAAGYHQHPGNAPAPFALQQQPPVPLVRAHDHRFAGQVASRPNIPYANPYSADTAVVVPSRDVGAVPDVQVSAYPVYVEGAAIQPEIYRTPLEKPGVQGSYSPGVATGVSGYHGVYNPDVDHYVQVYPGVQEASQIVPVGQEKDGKSKRLFKTFEDKNINDSPTSLTSANGENGSDRQLNDAGAKNVEEIDVAGRLSTCQEENCTLPIEKSRLNQLALAKARDVIRHFDKMKNPFRDCENGACSQSRKCRGKEMASGMCSSKKESSMASPVNGFGNTGKESRDYGRSKGSSDEELSSEAMEESGERMEGQNNAVSKPSTMEEQAMMTADAQLEAARPTLEGMGYILDVDTQAKKTVYPNKMIKIVKKNYFSQPLRLSSGRNVQDDGLWHAKTSAS
ncbi:uncharacterized protein LOC142586318 [Dermacentor variabilis]|uniref:uncharacterized protein LOC142586318 n=1 Tax=Dermacentor variabilis TaxID=34621 RepID=UPI003F5C6D02